nr:cytochrome c biogenesis protein CcdA [Cellulomonas endophytica]
MPADVGDAFGRAVAGGSLLLAVPVAVLAGLVSFASPCVLPLVPGYLGLLGGLGAAAGAAPGPRLGGAALPVAAGVLGAPAARRSSVGRATAAVPAVGTAPGAAATAAPGAAPGAAPAAGARRALVVATALFVLGFTLVFVAYGALAGSLGALLLRWDDVVTRVLGVVVLVMGLVFLGAVPALQRERRLHLAPRAGLWGAPLLGATFGIGWVPCIGPTLAAILTLGLQEGSAGRGAGLAVAFCVGLGLPFLLVALGVGRVGAVLRFLGRHRRATTRLGGALLVVLGLALVTGVWGTWAGWLQGVLVGGDPFVPVV